MPALLGTNGTNILKNSDRKAFYQGIADAGGERAFKFVVQDTERLWVGEDGLLVEGTLWNIVSGSELAGWNLELPEGGDPDGNYGVGYRMVLIMSFKDGKMVGEDTYYDSGVEVRELREPLVVPPVPSLDVI
jgi:hypothetical protein